MSTWKGWRFRLVINRRERAFRKDFSAPGLSQVQHLKALPIRIGNFFVIKQSSQAIWAHSAKLLCLSASRTHFMLDGNRWSKIMFRNGKLEKGDGKTCTEDHKVSGDIVGGAKQMWLKEVINRMQQLQVRKRKIHWLSSGGKKDQ